jgi:hypothetical protein
MASQFGFNPSEKQTVKLAVTENELLKALPRMAGGGEPEH